MSRSHALRLNAADLLRHPGDSRRLEMTIEPSELDLEDERLAGAIAVDLHATSSVDGIVVHGTVATHWRGQCRRCLIDVEGVATSEVEEVFQQHPRADEAVEIVGDQIDLAPIVREYVLLDLPDAPLCRDDCAGICPQCGADRNTTPCDCDTAPVDDRWSALEGLRLDPDGE